MRRLADEMDEVETMEMDGEAGPDHLAPRSVQVLGVFTKPHF